MSTIGTFTKNGNIIPRLAPEPHRHRRAPYHLDREEERDGCRLAHLRWSDGLCGGNGYAER